MNQKQKQIINQYIFLATEAKIEITKKQPMKIQSQPKERELTTKQKQIFAKLDYLSYLAALKCNYQKPQFNQSNEQKDPTKILLETQPQYISFQQYQKCQNFITDWQSFFPNQIYEKQSKFVLNLRHGIEKSFVDQKIITKVCSQLSQFYQPYQTSNSFQLKKYESKVNKIIQSEFIITNLYQTKSIVQPQNIKNPNSFNNLRMEKSKTIEIIENNACQILQQSANYNQEQMNNKKVDISFSMPNTSFLMLPSKQIKNTKQYILHCDQSIIAINPSFQLGIIPDKIMLTSSNLDVVISYFKLMILMNRTIGLVTTQEIFSKFKYFVKFVGNLLIEEQQKKSSQGSQCHIQTLFNQNCLIVQEDRYYRSNSFMFLFKRNLMWQPSCDLIVNESGKLYLFESAGVRQEKTVYAAWKKKMISQERYTGLVFNPDKYQWTTTKNGQSKKKNEQAKRLTLAGEVQDRGNLGTPMRLPVQKNLEQNEKIFRTLRKSPLFKLIPDKQLAEVMEAGQIVVLFKNQTIYHQKMPVDHVYIVISGEIINQTKKQTFHSSMVLGYQEWLIQGLESSNSNSSNAKDYGIKLKSDQNCNFTRALNTFIVNSQTSTLLKVSMAQLNFQLFFYLPDFRKIIQMDLEKELQVKENALPFADLTYFKYLVYISKNYKKKSFSKSFVQINLSPQSSINTNANSRCRIKIPQNEWLQFCRQRLCVAFM